METQYAWATYYDFVINRVEGFRPGSKDPLYVRAFRFIPTENGSGCQMHVKGSPTGRYWYGVGSIRDGEGFLVLPTLPHGTPFQKRPQSLSLAAEYITRLSGKKIRDYCLLESQGKEEPYNDLLTMAKTLTIPSRPLSSEELEQIPAGKMHLLSGYGDLEWIGIGYSPYIVPFVRKRPDSMWNLPVNPVVRATRVDPPTPLVRYEEAKLNPPGARRAPAKKKKRPPAKQKSRVRRRQQLSSSSTSEDEDSEQTDVPLAWECSLADAQVGTFAILESEYDGGHRGISLIKVRENKRHTLYHLIVDYFLVG
jgi:hypothetical protein